MIPVYENSVELSDAILAEMLLGIDARLEYVDSHAWTTVRCLRLVEEVRRLRRALSEDARRLRRALSEDARRIRDLEKRIAEMELLRLEFVEGRTIDWRERGSGA